MPNTEVITFTPTAESLPWWHSELGRRENRIPAPRRPSISKNAPRQAARLTGEQLDYLWLLMNGYSARVISEVSRRSQATVNRYLKRAVELLEAHDRIDAARQVFGYSADWVASLTLIPVAESSKSPAAAVNAPNAGLPKATSAAARAERAAVVRRLVPSLRAEIDTLIDLVTRERFNDPETSAAIQLLRELHGDLGRLLRAVETGKEAGLIARIVRKNEKLVELGKAGSKVVVVAPALTVGISHVISFLTKVPLDSTLISAIWAGVVAAPFADALKKKR